MYIYIVRTSTGLYISQLQYWFVRKIRSTGTARTRIYNYISLCLFLIKTIKHVGETPKRLICANLTSPIGRSAYAHVFPIVTECVSRRASLWKFKLPKAIIEDSIFSRFRHEIDIPNSEYIHLGVAVSPLIFTNQMRRCVGWIYRSRHWVSIFRNMLHSEHCHRTGGYIYVPSIALALALRGHGYRTYIPACRCFSDLVLNAWSWLVQNEDEVILDYR